jgi:hypothetical protein
MRTVALRVVPSGMSTVATAATFILRINFPQYTTMLKGEVKVRGKIVRKVCLHVFCTYRLRLSQFVGSGR